MAPRTHPRPPRAAIALSLVLPCLPLAAQESFFRGDCNASREDSGLAVDISDAVAVISHLFGNAAVSFTPPCLDACDANDDGLVDFADMVAITQYAYQFGRLPHNPGPGLLGPPGTDPTPDSLTCASASRVRSEDCSNGADDDGDGRDDSTDTDCEIVFAIGPNRYYLESVPEPLETSHGESGSLTFFIQSPRDEVQGFSMALKYDADVISWRPFMDFAYSAFELPPDYRWPDFAALHLSDGDEGELILSVATNLFPPFDGFTLEPAPGFQPIVNLTFEIADNPGLCGQCSPLRFEDGLKGRGIVPIRNLVTVGNRTIRPRTMDGEVCITDRPRFFRGDCSMSFSGTSAVDIADAAAVLSRVFGSGGARFDAPCEDACDCNDDGLLDLSDAACILDYQFAFGRQPRFPGPGVEPSGQPRPPGEDPTPDLLGCEPRACGGGLAMPTEDCNNSMDDDGDGLADAADPDCRQAFACGSLDPAAPETPGPLAGLPGETIQAWLFIENPDDGLAGPVQLDHVEGFSMALELSCDLEAGETFVTSGGALESMDAEYVSAQTDDDPLDGDGCEFLLGVLLDFEPPFRRQALLPADGFQPVGWIPLRIRDDEALCGSCLPVRFEDGLNGRGITPVKNLVSGANVSRGIRFLQSEVCVGNLDSNGDGKPDVCTEPLGARTLFLRADANSSGDVDLSDALHILGFLFLGDAEPTCRKSSDANADGSLTVTDALHVLRFLFLGGPPPPPPHGECGRDPAGSRLSCSSYAGCEGS